MDQNLGHQMSPNKRYFGVSSTIALPFSKPLVQFVVVPATKALKV